MTRTCSLKDQPERLQGFKHVKKEGNEIKIGLRQFEQNTGNRSDLYHGYDLYHIHLTPNHMQIEKRKISKQNNSKEKHMHISNTITFQSHRPKTCKMADIRKNKK